MDAEEAKKEGKRKAKDKGDEVDRWAKKKVKGR